MVKFDSDISQDHFRMGRITSVQVDKDGLVRTCKVAMRPRDAREKVLPYKAKEWWISNVSAQRIVVLCPVENQQEVIEASNQGNHRCPDSDNLSFGPDSVSNRSPDTKSP